MPGDHKNVINYIVIHHNTLAYVLPITLEVGDIVVYINITNYEGVWKVSSVFSYLSSILKIASLHMRSPSFIHWQATPLLHWIWLMFKLIKWLADCGIQSVIVFWKLWVCDLAKFIVKFVKCMVKIQWVIAWLGSGSECLMHDAQWKSKWTTIFG